MATITAGAVPIAEGAQRHGSQTIEGFVGAALDDAKITPLHVNVIALIAAGYFFDVFDYVSWLAGPGHGAQQASPPAQIAAVGSATCSACSSAPLAQGEFTDRFGRKTIYQFNLLLFGVFTIARRFRAERHLARCAALHRRRRHRRRAAAAFAYAGEYSPQADSRPHAGDRAFHRRRLLVADRVAVHADLPRSAWLARRLDRASASARCWCACSASRCRNRRAGWRPTAEASEALDMLERMGIAGPHRETAADRRRERHQKRPVRRRLPQVSASRVIAGMICFVGVLRRRHRSRHLAAEHHDRQGLHASPSRCTFTFGMTLAVPCASLFMMYALDKFGRKITSVCAFVGAGMMAIVFANAGPRPSCWSPASS